MDNGTPTEGTVQVPVLSDEALNIAITEKLMGKCAHVLHAYAKDKRSPMDDYTVYRCRKCKRSFSGLAYREGMVICPPYDTDWRAFGLVVEAMAKRGWERLSLEAILMSRRFLAVWSTVKSGLPERYVKAEDNTRLRAACLAALLAVESVVQPRRPEGLKEDNA